MNFGQARTVNEVRLYFKDSRPQSATYRAPSSYNIQYLNGSTWTTVANQVKSPAAPRANYNKVKFPAVSAQRVRVLATNASGAKTGLTEIKIFNRGGVHPPDPQPNPNLALSATPSCSFTSAWESCAAINNGDEPTSSNFGGPNQGNRWGTWSEHRPAVGRADRGRRRSRSTGRRCTSSTTTGASTCRRRGSCSTGTAAPTSTCRVPARTDRWPTSTTR